MITELTNSRVIEDAREANVVHIVNRVRTVVYSAVKEYRGIAQRHSVPKSTYFSLFEDAIERDGEIVWVIEVDDRISSFRYETQLVTFAIGVYTELDEALKDVKFLDYFRIETEDIDFHLEHWTKRIVLDYLIHLPYSIHRAANQNLRGTITSLIKKSIEPDLKELLNSEIEGGCESGTQLGPPRRLLNLVEDGSLKPLIKQFPEANLVLMQQVEHVEETLVEYLKTMTKDKQGYFDRYPPLDRVMLYKDLHRAYKSGFGRYKSEDERFRNLSNSFDKIEWRKHWSLICDRELSHLQYANLINDKKGGITAADLAYKQLASQYDYTPKYMRRLIKESRRIIKGRNV